VIGVLVSGEGTNLQALIDEGLEVVGVASNNPKARALERARAAAIDAAVFDLGDFATREERDRAMGLWLSELGAEIAVLAGYMHILTRPFLEIFPDRIINVHPSLLPAFPGLDAIREALEAGATETGVTVHLVDEGVDSGPVILQAGLPVFDGDTVDSLRKRIQEVEHRLLPHGVRLFLEGKVLP
jgi:phosphoribosylglycinamide formyltransferase-1